ncbi:hypothetical protein CYMTET_3924 [Cymbomonas tetramitiformis]|uniref:Uncharacterized protein n=1 Tax=Cymbomonas tetramitiformis TaxID=36881 RepID=A0AAE0H2B5_9CHLO|nr:hypothetical protein CYMTET_3924 [Cymbomonas tetramitiformis]
MPTSEADRERLAALDASDRKDRQCRLHRERSTLAVHIERATRARLQREALEASESEAHRKRVSSEMNPANKRARITELAATRAMLHERYLLSATELTVPTKRACAWSK